MPGSLINGAKILELGERNGFGFAMKEGLKEVTTPYVIVVQHDRNFKDSADVVQVVAAMKVNRIIPLWVDREAPIFMYWCLAP